MKFFKNFKNFLLFFFIDFSLGVTFLEVESWSKTAFTTLITRVDAFRAIFRFRAFFDRFCQFFNFFKNLDFFTIFQKNRKKH
jgi:hypothetical protein